MSTLIVALSVFVVLAILIGVVFWTVPIARWYVAAFLARYDFIFTNVPESYFKVVVRFGAHRKTLLSKQGYKIDDEGDIIEGEDPEISLPGGLRFIGWPFIDKVYKRKMKFLKSLPDGEVKAYDVENIDRFYAKVDYPYALPFVKCEDKNNLPLIGHATLLAHVVNPAKSLFATANFYDTMVGLILPVVRKRLEKFTFDEIKEKPDLDVLMWEEFNMVQPAGLVGTEDDVNVLDELREKYGVVVVALRIVNVDPQDEDLRKIGLTKYRADREADAANAVARAEARKAAGPIGIAMDEWVKKERNPKETLSQAKARLRESGEYKIHKKLLADQINRSRGTVQERKVDITSGGEPLEGGSISSIAGSIAAAIIGATAGKNIADKDNPGGEKSNDKKGEQKRVSDMTEDEKRALDREFDAE